MMPRLSETVAKEPEYLSFRPNPSRTVCKSGTLKKEVLWI
jgi:hypothetical protein